MARKLILVAILIVIAAVAAWAATFYWQNFRGIGPALKDPPQDIAQVINTTGMPLKLPPGFSIEIFAKDLGNPRVLALDPGGNLVVSIPGQDRVVALPDKNKDGVADEVITIA